MGSSRIPKVTYAHLPEIPSHTRTKYQPIIRNETETDVITQIHFLYERLKGWVSQEWLILKHLLITRAAFLRALTCSLLQPPGSHWEGS